MTYKFMRKVLLILWMLPSVLQAQYLQNGMGARNEGLAKSTIAVPHLWSISNNPSGIAYLKSPEIGVFYTNRFLMKELSTQSIAAVYPSKWLNIGLSVEHFGYSELSELQAGLAVAKTFNKYFSLGFKFNYLEYRQAEVYGTARAFLVQIGLTSNPIKDIYIGAHIYNPSRAKFNTLVSQYVPTIFSLGAAYKPDRMVGLTAQIDKSLEAELTYKMGVEFNVTESLYIRAGVNVKPNAYFLGVAYYFKNIRLDIAFSHQQVVGISPSASMGYVFEKQP